jgi:hypothetical protein
MHKFVIMINGVLHTYTEYNDIPENFDHVIEFIPEISDGPHTDDEHDEISKWNERLQLLIAKENSKIANRRS